MSNPRRPIGFKIIAKNESKKLSTLTDEDKSTILSELLKFSKNSSEGRRRRIAFDEDDINFTIHVTRYPDQYVERENYESIKYYNWECTSDSSAWSQKICKEKIQGLVVKKEKKLEKYRTYLERVCPGSSDVRLMLVANKCSASGIRLP